MEVLLLFFFFSLHALGTKDPLYMFLFTYALQHLPEDLTSNSKMIGCLVSLQSSPVNSSVKQNMTTVA